MSERLVFELQAIDRATAPLRAVQQQVTRTAANINAATASMRSFARDSALADTATQKWAKGALQQAGFQIGDFAVQVASGTSSIQAFGQQAPQMLQIFGPAGAVIGAAVAILAAFGTVAQKSGQQVEDLGSALGVLQAPVVAIQSGLASIGQSLGGLFGPLINEIDTAIIALGLFAGVMAMRAIPSMFAAASASGIFSAAMATFRAAVVASAISAGSFNTVLTLTKAAMMTLGAAAKAVGAILMRFLPVAILIGLAKLIEIFLRLKDGAGGFGEAMKLLGDLVKAVWTGMVESAKAVPPALSGVWLSIQSGFMSMISNIMWAWGNAMAAMGDAVSQVMPNVGAKFQEAAAAAMTSSNDWMDSSIKASDDATAAFEASGNKISSAWGGVSEAWGALKDAVAAGTEEVDIFGDAAVAASEKANGAAEKAEEGMSQHEENMRAIADTMKQAIGGAFMSMIEGTKSVKDAFRDMARIIIARLFEILVVQRIVNGIMGFVGMAFPALAPAIAGARAMGGPVTGGKAYLVGERGPELVVPSRNSQVIPNNQMGGGGVTVIQNNTFGAGVTRAEIQAMLPKIVESTKVAVFDAQRRSVNGMGYA